MTLLLQLIANGIVNGANFALLAISFGIVYRTIKVFHIAFAGIFTCACYFSYIFFTFFKFPIFISFILSVFFSGILGFLIEKFIYLPFYKKKATPGVILIASLGVYYVLENFIAMLFGNETKVLLSGVQPTLNIGEIILTRIQIYQLLTGLIIIFLFWLFLKKLKIFKALWAMGDQPELISIFGLPLYKLRAFVFFISSILLSIPAVLISFDIGMDPHQGMHYFLIAVVSVLFGGIDNFKGWWIGGFLLGILQSIAVWQFSARWIDLVTFLILIFVLIFKPTGILGLSKRLEEA